MSGRQSPHERPSPHRFVISGSNNNDRRPVKTPSRLSRQLRPDASGDAPPSTGPTQSSKAARFVIATPGSQPQHGSPSTPRPRFSLTQQERREDVQEALSQSDHDDDGEPIPTSVEDDGIYAETHVSLDQSPKRRRVEATGLADAAGISPRNASSRFALQQTQPSNIGDARPSSRPAFLKSSIPAQQPDEPLPDVFSPHKKGQRFVPGGMAAELQSWIFETGNAALQSRRGQDYLRGEDYAITIQVHEVSGSGPFFVYAETSDGIPQRVVLVEGSHRVIRTEDIIGIRSPIWTVTVDGKDWTISVDYKILS